MCVCPVVACSRACCCPLSAQVALRQFLNALCGAHVFLHIIDVSGCTNEKGEVTVGYDPSVDVEWLKREVRACCRRWTAMIVGQQRRPYAGAHVAVHESVEPVAKHRAASCCNAVDGGGDAGVTGAVRRCCGWWLRLAVGCSTSS